MVSGLTFYSDDASLNPAEAYSFCSVKLFEKREKEAVDGPFLNIRLLNFLVFLVWGPLRPKAEGTSIYSSYFCLVLLNTHIWNHGTMVGGIVVQMTPPSTDLTLNIH